MCGKRLCKVKSKDTVYPCTHNQDSLLKCFGIDVSQGESTIHTLKFCNPCYAVIRRWAIAFADGVHYTHSVQLMDWSPHTESTCLVRNAVLLKKQKQYGQQNNNMSTHTIFSTRALIDINGLTLTDFLGQECS